MEPAEAETVRMIFGRYLELGSMGALIAELDRREVRTKASRLANGRVRGGVRFGLGTLAHVLKNRFYIGELVYGGGVHHGQHEPILARALFEAVQAKLASNAVARQVRRKGSAAILTGRIFDDRGNRMSPTHANKRGVRYRYYVSHALLQKRKTDAGSVTRVPAPDVEALVLDDIRKRFVAAAAAPAMSDRDLIERHIERVIIKSQAVEVWLVAGLEGAARTDARSDNDTAQSAQPGSTIMLPWTAPSFAAVKGVIHAPSGRPAIHPDTREALLTAIAKARSWIDEIRLGGVGSFAEIAEREGKQERYVRMLALLAFVSPRIITAIIDGTAPAHLTVAGLAKSRSCSWAEAECKVGLLR